MGLRLLTCAAMPAGKSFSVHTANLRCLHGQLHAAGGLVLVNSACGKRPIA
jgi:hypothetical protein